MLPQTLEVGVPHWTKSLPNSNMFIDLSLEIL